MAILTKKKALVFGLVIVAAIILAMMIVVFNLLQRSGSNPPGHPDIELITPEISPEVTTPVKVLKPESRGGSITFSLPAGTYEEPADLELYHENLQSTNGDEIPSDIYYTTDGTEPTRENARKYNPGEKIIFISPGNHTIMAKLFSTVGKYQGDVYSQTYMIKPKPTIIPVIVKPVPEPIKPKPEITKPDPVLTKPEPQKPVITAIETITNFMQLDEEIRQDFYECTEKLVFELEGIEKIEKEDRKIQMEIYISQYGQAKMEQISGIKVTPQDKDGEFRAILAEKIKSIKFLSPTRKGKPVKARFWIDFKKIASLGSKIMLAR